MAGPSSKRAAPQSSQVPPPDGRENADAFPRDTDFLGPSLPGPSWPARIGSSAAHLAHDVLGKGGYSTTSGLASSLGATGKAGSSAAAAGASGNAWAQNGPSRSTWGGRYTSRPESSLRSEFRSAPQSDNEIFNAIDFDTFLQQDSSSFTTPRVEGQDLTYQQQQSIFQQDTSGNTLGEYQAESDGAEVIELLSRPKSMLSGASLQLDIATEQQDAETTVADLFGEESLTQSERDVHRQIRNTVSSHATATPQATLRYDQMQTGNLVPMNCTSSSTSRPSSSHSAKLPRQLHPNTEVLHLPLHSDPAVRRLSITSDSSVTFFSSRKEREEWYSHWVEEWDDVLNNYQQAVWSEGEVPRLGEARREIEEVKIREQQGEEWWNDTAAIRRLRQVLGHLGAKTAPIHEAIQTNTQSVLEAAWSDSHSRGKRKARQQNTDEPQFRCPDCEGIYDTDEHLVQHDQWAASSDHVASKIEAELRRQVQNTGPHKPDPYSISRRDHNLEALADH